MALIADVNYLAVLVCSVVAMGLSMFWYSPIIFGKTCMESIEKTEEELRKDFNPIKNYGLSFAGYFLMAYVLARLMIFISATTVAEGIRLSFLCWLGFISTTMIINSLLERKSVRRLLVDGGYHLMIILVFGIILGAWA